MWRVTYSQAGQMILVEVHPGSARVVTSKRDRSKTYSVQTLYVHTIDHLTGKSRPHPESVDVFLPTGHVGYAPGRYTFDPSALYIGLTDGGQRRLSVAPRLVPVPAK